MADDFEMGTTNRESHAANNQLTRPSYDNVVGYGSTELGRPSVINGFIFPLCEFIGRQWTEPPFQVNRRSVNADDNITILRDVDQIAAETEVNPVDDLFAKHKA